MHYVANKREQVRQGRWNDKVAENKILRPSDCGEPVAFHVHLPEKMMLLSFDRRSHRAGQNGALDREERNILNRRTTGRLSRASFVVGNAEENFLGAPQ